MIINRIELENIKIHKNFACDFSKGTIAIVGENGAGKTTIVEAIGWVLFDYLGYSQKDFVSRGEKKGSIRLNFTSSYDDREYVVERDTNGNFWLLDAELNVKVAVGKKEVLPLLQKHLGIEKSVDTRKLFECAIGVPQGSFTSDFLASPDKRKDVFNKLLRVEEYEKASDKLLDTDRYALEQINKTQNEIAWIEGQISGFDKLLEEKRVLEDLQKRLKVEISELEAKISETEKLMESLEEKAVQIYELEKRLELLKSQESAIKKMLTQKREEFTRAKEARERVEKYRGDYENYERIEHQILDLNKQIAERDRLRTKESELYGQISREETLLKGLTERLKEVEQKVVEIKNLEPLIAEYEQLEEKRILLQNNLTKERFVRERKEKLENDRRKLLVEYKECLSKIETIRERVGKFDGDLESLETRYRSIIKEIGGINARLEFSKKFKEGIKNNLCPIFSQRCLNLAENQTLDEFIRFASDSEEEKIKKLELEKQQIEAQKRDFEEIERERLRLSSLEGELSKIEQKGRSIKEEIENLELELKSLSSSEKELEEVKARLKKLGNPKERVEVLKRDIARKDELEQKLSKSRQNFEHLSYELKQVKEALTKYSEIDLQLKKLNEGKEKFSFGYHEFVRNKAISENFDKLKLEVEKLEKEVIQTERSLSELVHNLDSIRLSYDAEIHREKRLFFEQLKSEKVRKETELRQNIRRIEEIDKSLAELEEKRKKLDESRRKLDELKKTYELIKFTRDVLKKAGPVIAANMRRQISTQASRIFQEIMGRVELTLEWTEDYGIEIEEKGNRRSFSSLSGGEQMTAALSVRLALLEELSEVRFAFFDEPTAHMDEERRVRLSEQIEAIAQTKRYSQLFIISHDDTFESKVDKVIRVERWS
ncbi:MAG: SMC family ATPase [Pyrinomonadaceae bacterium]|nr:SMC family ATPase [Pyrinomonadaceae bacterium]